MGGLSVEVGLTAHVVVQWPFEGWIALQGLLVQLLFQDRFNAPIRWGAKVQRPNASGFQTSLSMCLALTDNTHAGSKSVFRMRSGRQHHLQHSSAIGANLFAPIRDPSRSPFEIALMRFGPVFIQGGKLSPLKTPHVSGDAFGLMEQFHGGVGKAHLQPLVNCSAARSFAGVEQSVLPL